ncbi:MAG: hypothetical protein ABIE74_00345 [Pseudomonadota bacterium]
MLNKTSNIEHYQTLVFVRLDEGMFAVAATYGTGGVNYIGTRLTGLAGYTQQIAPVVGTASTIAGQQLWYRGQQMYNVGSEIYNSALNTYLSNPTFYNEIGGAAVSGMAQGLTNTTFPLTPASTIYEVITDAAAQRIGNYLRRPYE